MKKTATDRVVLAYSGGPKSSAAIPWLIEQRRAEVVTVTLDLGQECDLAAVRARALSAGAIRAHVIDAREEFVRDFILPSLQAGVRSDSRFPLAVALGRPLIAKRLVDVARMERASAIAHGEIEGAEPSRLNVLMRSLDASFDVLAPLTVCQRTKNDTLTHARALKGVDRNLWGRSVVTSSEADAVPPQITFTRTHPVESCLDDPAFIQIDFVAGIPVRGNGIDMPLLELIESVDVIAGAHGVGRIVRSGRGAQKRSNAALDAPAAIVLETAYAALERKAISPDLLRLKHRLGRAYADLVRDGSWFSPTREAIDAFVRNAQPHVTGSVVLKLWKGTCVVAAVKLSRSGVDVHDWPVRGAIALARQSQGLVS